MALDKKRLIELEEKMIRKKNDIGMIGGTVRLVPLVDARPNIWGRIHLITYDAEIRLNKEWQPEKRAGMPEYLKKKNITDPIECTSLDVTAHEAEHWKRCPRTLDNRIDLLEAAAKEFEAAGKKAYVTVTKNGRTKEEFSGDVIGMENTFEDLVLHANRRAAGEGNGIVIFFRDQNTFTPFYEAYVKLNMKIWGDKIDEELVKRCYAPQKKFLMFKSGKTDIDAIVNKIMKEFGCTDDLERNLRILNDKDNWPTLAAIFTKHMLPLYEQPPYPHDGDSSAEGGGQSSQQEDGGGQGQKQEEQKKEEKSDQGKEEEEKKEGKDEKKDEKEGNQGGKEEKKDEMDKKKGEGEGKEQKEEEKKEEKGAGKGDQKKPWDGNQPPTGPGTNPFDEAMEDEDSMRKAVEERVRRNMAKGGKKGAPAGILERLDPHLCLDVIYEMLAPEVKIIAKNEKGNGWSYPIIPFGKEPFDPALHDLIRIRLNKMMLNKDGELVFAAAKDKYPIDIKIIEGIMKFRDLYFILDTSGSMIGRGNTSQIPWGDESPYHHALLGGYGILKYLRNAGIAPYIKYGAMNFSNATIFSGQTTFSDLREFKRVLLSPQQGGTEINIEVIENEFGDKDKAVVILLSDGEIYNWGSIRKRFMTVMMKHLPIFVAIGGETDTSKDFKKAGFPTYHVRNVEDLSKLMIDASARVYSQPISEEGEETTKLRIMAGIRARILNSLEKQKAMLNWQRYL